MSEALGVDQVNIIRQGPNHPLVAAVFAACSCARGRWDTFPRRARGEVVLGLQAGLVLGLKAGPENERNSSKGGALPLRVLRSLGLGAASEPWIRH